MNDGDLLATASFITEADGIYYEMTDLDGEVSDPVGPFETQELAEAGLEEAIAATVVEIMKTALGLE